MSVRPDLDEDLVGFNCRSESSVRRAIIVTRLSEAGPFWEAAAVRISTGVAAWHMPMPRWCRRLPWRTSDD
jgi:hypothetical protein